jgi:ABC-2 type transport system ATP-binding protein
LLSTHILPEVEMTCDRVIIIHRGQVAAAGSLAELRQQAGAQGVIVVEADDTIDSTPIRALAEVAQVQSEQAPQGTRLRVTTDHPEDVAQRLCSLAVTHGWKLRELRPQRQTLEELFIRITGREDVADVVLDRR